MAQQQRYYSDLKTEYINGNLPPNIIKNIPRSNAPKMERKEQDTFLELVTSKHNIFDSLAIAKLVNEKKV